MWRILETVVLWAVIVSCLTLIGVVVVYLAWLFWMAYS